MSDNTHRLKPRARCEPGAGAAASLNAIAVAQILVVPSAVVRVKEIVVIVLVFLPLSERAADGENDKEEDIAEGIVVDAQGLAGALTAGLRGREKS